MGNILKVRAERERQTDGQRERQMDSQRRESDRRERKERNRQTDRSLLKNLNYNILHGSIV